MLLGNLSQSWVAETNESSPSQKRRLLDLTVPGNFDEYGFVLPHQRTCLEAPSKVFFSAVAVEDSKSPSGFPSLFFFLTWKPHRTRKYLVKLYTCFLRFILNNLKIQQLKKKTKILISSFVSTISLLTALIPINRVHLNFHHKEFKFH